MYINISTYVCVSVNQKGCTITVEYLEMFHTLKHVYIYIHIYVCVHVYKCTHLFVCI